MAVKRPSTTSISFTRPPHAAKDWQGRTAQPKPGTATEARPPHAAKDWQGRTVQPKPGTATEARPPHPATVWQGRTLQPKPGTATEARPPHAAKVWPGRTLQPKPGTATETRPPHPATVPKSDAVQPKATLAHLVGAAGSTIQPLSVEEAHTLAKQWKLKDVYDDFINYSLVEQKKTPERDRNTEKAVLKEEDSLSLRESLVVWSQPENRKALRRYASYGEGFLLGKADMWMSVADIFDIEKELKRRGKEEGLATFLRIAGIKGLTKTELLDHINTYFDTVREREYPYPFPNKEAFLGYSAHINKLVSSLNIDYFDIRLMGSALRKSTPKDLDIGIMVSPEEFKRLVEVLRELCKGRGGIADTLEQYASAGNIGIKYIGMLGKGQNFQLKELLEEYVGKTDVTPVLTIVEAGSRLDSELYMSLPQ